jgi:general secretion pathway protein I
MSEVRHSPQSGFTLIEVLVAFTILSISLAVVLNVFAGGLRQTDEGKEETIASALAQSMLARVGTDIPIRVGTSEGRFDNGFTWRLSILPFADGTDQSAVPVVAEKVTVAVVWNSGANERSISLATIKLSPKGQQP